MLRPALPPVSEPMIIHTTLRFLEARARKKEVYFGPRICEQRFAML